MLGQTGALCRIRPSTMDKRLGILGPAVVLFALVACEPKDDSTTPLGSVPTASQTAGYSASPIGTAETPDAYPVEQTAQPSQPSQVAPAVRVSPQDSAQASQTVEPTAASSPIPSPSPSVVPTSVSYTFDAWTNGPWFVPGETLKACFKVDRLGLPFEVDVTLPFAFVEGVWAPVPHRYSMNGEVNSQCIDYRLPGKILSDTQGFSVDFVFYVDGQRVKHIGRDIAVKNTPQ